MYIYTSPKLYRCYYPHRSRDLVSPVCGIFLNVLVKTYGLFKILTFVPKLFDLNFKRKEKNVTISLFAQLTLRRSQIKACWPYLLFRLKFVLAEEQKNNRVAKYSGKKKNSRKVWIYSQPYEVQVTCILPLDYVPLPMFLIPHVCFLCTTILQ